MQNAQRVSNFSRFKANFGVRACHFWHGEVLKKTEPEMRVDAGRRRRLLDGMRSGICFNEGGLKESGMKFCLYCGAELVMPNGKVTGAAWFYRAVFMLTAGLGVVFSCAEVDVM